MSWLGSLTNARMVVSAATVRERSVGAMARGRAALATAAVKAASAPPDYLEQHSIEELQEIVTRAKIAASENAQ